MTITWSSIIFLVVACFGTYFVIFNFSKSRVGIRLAIPAMVLEIALGYGLGKFNTGATITHGPTYVIGEVGVVAIIASGALHIVTTAERKILRHGALIAVLGVTFSIVLIGGATLGAGRNSITAFVIGLALAPTSAGVASRVLVLAGKNKSYVGQTFFVTAIIDDAIGLLGLALLELLATHKGSNALTGIIIEVGAGIAAGALFHVTRRLPSGYLKSRLLGLTLWSAIAIFTVLATMLGSSPIVVAFLLVAGLSPILSNSKKASDIVEKSGILLVPLFFVSLGAIAASLTFPGTSAVLLSILLSILAVGAKVFAARLGYGSTGFVSLGAMLVPRAEITFVIALLGRSLGLLTDSDFFIVALCAVTLSVAGSLVLPRLVAKV